MTAPQFGGSLAARSTSTSVPGVDYQSLLDAARNSLKDDSSQFGGSLRVRRAASYQQNLNLIQQQQAQYQQEQQQAQQAEQERAQRKAPFWAKALEYVGKAFEYSSGSTYTRMLPGVGEGQKWLEKNIPGAKTALEVATNPLTYLTLGEGGLGIGLTNVGLATGEKFVPALARGLGAAAAGGAGAALGEKYQEAGLPGGKYAPIVGSFAGMPLGVKATENVLEGGLGNLPVAGRFVPEGLAGVGVNESVRVAAEAKATAQAAAKAEALARQQGHPSVGDTLWTNDGKTFTFRKPTPVRNAIQLTADDLGDPATLMADAVHQPADPSSVYVAVSKQDAYGIASSHVRKGSQFYSDLTDIAPNETVIRVPRKYTTLDQQTGRYVLKNDLGAGDISIFTNDTRGGAKAWKSVSGLVGDEKVADWYPVNPPSPEEAAKYTWDGAQWIKSDTLDEASAQGAASAAAGYHVGLSPDQQAAVELARQQRMGYRPSVPTEAAPIPEGQMALPGVAQQVPTAARGERAPRLPQALGGGEPGYQPPMPGLDRFTYRLPQPPEGMRAVRNPRARALDVEQSVFDIPDHPRIQQIREDTLNPNVEGGGGSSTNIAGQQMAPGTYGLSIYPGRTQIVPAAEFERNTQAILAHYKQANSDLLEDPTRFVGTWRDPKTNNISLDVSVNTPDEQQGYALMEQYNQKAMARINEDGTATVLENPKYDETRGPEAMAAGTADEVREAQPRTPNVEIQKSATDYNAQHGLPEPLPQQPYIDVNPQESARIAKAYEDMPRFEDLPPGEQANVRHAYRKMGEETQAQWDWATQHDGMTFEPWDAAVHGGQEQPYLTAQQMRDDVNNNKHLYFFTGGEDNLFLGNVTRDPATGLTLNDKFRAVHDYYGHAKEGYDFGPRGEENAWISHSQMFSDTAQKAMTTETRGQNSWGNFRTPEVRQGAEPFVFPEQKMGLLPPDMTDWRAALAERTGEVLPTPGAELPTQHMTLVHYGPKELTEINPEFQGTGVPSEELKRAGVNPSADARFASYYEENARPEKFFINPKTGEQTAQGAFRHTIEGDYKILDLNSEEGRAFRAAIGKKDLDVALRQAGYDGYKVGDQGTVRMYGKRQVTTVNGKPIENPAQSNIIDEVPQGRTSLQMADDGSSVDVAFGGAEKPTAPAAPEAPAPEVPGRVVSRTGLGGEVPDRLAPLRQRIADMQPGDKLELSTGQRLVAGERHTYTLETADGQPVRMKNKAFRIGSATTYADRVGLNEVNPRGRAMESPRSAAAIHYGNPDDVVSMLDSGSARDVRVSLGSTAQRDYSGGILGGRVRVLFNPDLINTEQVGTATVIRGVPLNGDTIHSIDIGPSIKRDVRDRIKAFANEHDIPVNDAADLQRNQSRKEWIRRRQEQATRRNAERRQRLQEGGQNPRGQMVNGVEQNPVTPEDIIGGTRQQEVDRFLNEVAGRGGTPREVQDAEIAADTGKRPTSWYIDRAKPRARLGKKFAKVQNEVISELRNRAASGDEEAQAFLKEHRIDWNQGIEDWNAPIPADNRPNWVDQILHGESTPDQFGRTGLTINKPEDEGALRQAAQLAENKAAAASDRLDNMLASGEASPEAVQVARDRLASAEHEADNLNQRIQNLTARRPMASETYGERGVAAENAGKQLLMSLFEDESINPRARMAEHGMLYGTGAKNEAGNFLPETVKKLHADGKIISGSKGAATVQDIFGRMLAADILLHGGTDEEAMARFGQMVSDQFGIDLKQAITGTGVQKGAGNTLEDFVRLRATHYINKLLMKPTYNEGELTNAKRLMGLLLSADPQAGRWYENTLPTVYELFGEDDGNTFLKFLAATSQQKTPRDNLQLALDAFADYKLGHFADAGFRSYGVQPDVMERLRYIAEGGEPTGLKINAFHGALTLDDFNAPVDRWMFRIFGYDDEKVASSKLVHETIGQQMRYLADELGMTPREVQARLWVAARNEGEGMNVVNEPYEELLLGGGKYHNDTGQLLPDMESETGLPTAKQTLQHILDMRDRGVIDLPKDTKAAQLKAEELVKETDAFRQGKVKASLAQARSQADAAGIKYAPDEDALTILDRVNQQKATGPVFTPADAIHDEGVAQEHQLSFAGDMENPDEITQYNPTQMAKRSAELDDWTRAGHLHNNQMPQDLQAVRDDFAKRIDGYTYEKPAQYRKGVLVRKAQTIDVPPMTDREVAVRYQQDARTAEWQKQLLQEKRPDAVDMQIPEQKSARLFGQKNAPTSLAGEGAHGPTPLEVTPTSDAEKLATLKDDLRKAGVPEENIDATAQAALAPAAKEAASTDAGEAIRAASRDEALSPSPYGEEAYMRSRMTDAPQVNGRPVIATTASQDYLASPGVGGVGRTAREEGGKMVESIIANSEWAPKVDQQFADAVDFSVNILDRTPYRLGGTAPRSGGLYYREGEIGVYNDVPARPSFGNVAYETENGVRRQVAGTPEEAQGILPRSDTTIHLNPTELYRQAQWDARRAGVPVHQALADQILETALHETAHDIAYHVPAGTMGTATADEQFLRVLNSMKEHGAADIEAQRNRLRAVTEQWDKDGTLLKWENDNARIRRTDNLARSVRVGRNPEGHVPGLPEQAAANPVRGEGVSPGASERGGEPAAGVRATGGAEEPGTASGPGLPERGPAAARRVQRTELDATGDAATANPRGRTATTPGAPGQPDIVAVRVPAPRVLEKAGDGKAFETPVPEGERISGAAHSMAQVEQDIFKDNNLRKAALRVARANPLVKRVLETVAGKAGTAATGLEKDIAVYAVKTDIDKSRIVGLMAELRQSKRPFDKLADNLTNITDWRGNKVVVPFGDVLSHPNNFRLSAAQEGYVNRYHQIVDELVADARAQGIDIKELGLTKGEGSHYVPRWVQGADGVDIEAPYTKGGVGSKQRFERPRYYDTEAQGIAKGVQYHDSEAALENFAQSIMKRTRDKEIIDRVRQYGRTPSELAGPEARAPLDAQVLKLKQARSAVNAAQRDLDRLTGKDTAVQAGTKRLSTNDVRAQVAAHPDVKAAQTALADAQKTRASLQAKYDAAVKPDAQQRLGMRLDKAKGDVLDAQDALKTARKTVREGITGADQEKVTGLKGASKAQVKAAKERLAAAQTRYQQVFQGTKQTRGEFRQILNAKAASFKESGAKFGMGGDIIPVRQSREIPGLQGRIFPAEVMDVLERGLADKGSRALQGVASVNDLARMFTTSTDFGATMLQGLPVLAYNPKAWAKATVKSVQAFFRPRALQEYYAANRQTVNEISNYVGGISNNEFFSSAVGGKTLVGRAAANPIPLVNAPAKAVERFGVSFDAFLDVAKIEMWKALSPAAKGDTGKLEELGRFIRNMTGTTSTARLGVSTTQRQVESLLMFSPRFTRSVFALGAQTFERGAGGAQARRALGGLIFGAMALYAGTKMALNKTGVTDEPFNWKDFDPTQGGRFMSIKVGDNYIGLGGSMRGAIQLLGMAGAAAATDPSRFLSGETTAKDANPFLKYIRGRSSPATGEVWNLITGKDAIGQEYDGHKDWLTRLPDSFVPFAVQSLVETEGGAGQKFGVFGAQTVGLRTFPGTKNEDLSAAMADVMKKMPTDLPGFSQAERDQIQSWADLTKYQKQALLQRAPELRQLLDAKEKDFWTQSKQVQADTDAAKRTLGQQLLATEQKQATGQPLTVDDLTAEQYRSALADVQQKQRAALAALNGANAITGLGGEDFPGGPRTHRQAVISDYYAAMDGANFIDPQTGAVDFNKRDEIEAKYLASLPQSERDIIDQEKGAEYDSVARDLKQAKLALAPYWNLGDQVAQHMGFANAQDLSVNGTKAQQSTYNTQATRLKQQYRRSHPDIDALLVKWDYTSTPINQQKAKRRTPPLGRTVKRTPLMSSLSAR